MGAELLELPRQALLAAGRQAGLSVTADELRDRLATVDRAMHHVGPFGAAFVVVSTWLLVILWKGDVLLFIELWPCLWHAWWLLLVLWIAWAGVSWWMAGRVAPKAPSGTVRVTGEPPPHP